MRAFTLSFAGELAVLAVLSVCCPYTAVAQVDGNGDYDRDYDVDEDDFSNWAACMGGQGEYVDPSSSCAAFDFDADLDVDAEDFGRFQAAYLQPTSPTCTLDTNRALAAKHMDAIGGLVGASARITPFLNIDLCEDSPSPQTFSAVWVGASNSIQYAQIGYIRRCYGGMIIDGIYAENRASYTPGGYDICYNNSTSTNPFFPPCLGNGGIPGAGLPNATYTYSCYKPYHPQWTNWWYLVDDNWMHSWAHDDWFLSASS